MTCGIYKITNKINEKSYIGASINIEKRFKQHKRYESTFGKHLKQEGVENFTFKIIQECSPDDLEEKEIQYIAKYDSYNNGYNKTKGGESHFNKTGFYRVHKNKANELHNGFTWAYVYPAEPYKPKQISSTDLTLLKEQVINQGLPWYVVDEDKAAKSLSENIPKTLRYTKNNVSGFYNVSKIFDEIMAQGFFWEYKHQIGYDTYKSIARVDLDELKEEVLAKNYNWEIIDEEKAKQSMEENKNNKHINNQRENKTGFYRLSKNYSSEIRQGYIWRYQYYDEFGLKQVVSNVDFYKIEKMVKDKGLPWIITDTDKAKITLKEAEENSVLYVENPNITGYYHVYKSKNNNVRQGFMYKYDFHDENNKRIIIQNADLNKLKDRVISKGYTWKVVDQELAELTDAENKSFEKYHKPYSSTGFYRVSKETVNWGKGYRWVYQYMGDDKRNRKVSSVDLLKLEDKVKCKGLPWFVTDDDLANNTLKKEYGDTLF